MLPSIVFLQLMAFPTRFPVLIRPNKTAVLRGNTNILQRQVSLSCFRPLCLPSTGQLPSPLPHFLSTGCQCRAYNSFLPGRNFTNAEPHYADLKAFCGVCYPWLRPYTCNKLEPKSKRCVFLGYVPTAPLKKDTDVQILPLVVSMSRTMQCLMNPFFLLPPFFQIPS